MEDPKPTPEHDWLARLVGEWTFEHECQMGPDQPPLKLGGAQTTQAVGPLWIVGEMLGAGPDGEMGRSLITLGYDPAQQRFVGTFVASCMTHLWVYDGALDAERRVLTLDAEGPSFSGDGTMTLFQDIIESIDADHYTLSSRYRAADGTWVSFMTGLYTRKPSVS